MKYGIIIRRVPTSHFDPELDSPLALTLDGDMTVPKSENDYFDKMLEYFRLLQDKLKCDEAIQHIINGSELKTREFEGFNGDESYKFSGVSLGYGNQGLRLAYSFINANEDVITVDWVIELISIL